MNLAPGWLQLIGVICGAFGLGVILARLLGFESMQVSFGVLMLIPVGLWSFIDDKRRAREDRKRWLKPPTP